MAGIPVGVILPPPLDSAFGQIAESIIGGRFLDHVTDVQKDFSLAEVPSGICLRGCDNMAQLEYIHLFDCQEGFSLRRAFVT